MKTKLFILFAAIAFTFGTANVYADGGEGTGTTTTALNEGKVTLTVELNPIQTLVVNESQKNVKLTYLDLDDYSKGAESKNEEHLTVTSTGAYEVKVQSEKDVFDTDDTENLNVIASADIQIIATGASKDGDVFSTKNLASNEARTIASSTEGGISKSINVTYKGAGDNKYLVENFVRGKKVTLTNTVTYTIVAQ